MQLEATSKTSQLFSLQAQYFALYFHVCLSELYVYS